MQTCKTISKYLPWHSLTAQLYLQFLLRTQHEVLFTNTSEEKKGRVTEHNIIVRLDRQEIRQKLKQQRFAKASR